MMINRKKIFFILLFTSLTFKGLLYIGNYYLISDWMYFGIDISVLILISSVIKLKNTTDKKVISTIIAITIFCYSFSFIFNCESGRTYIISPQETHTLIVSEYQKLSAATYIYVYEKKNFLFKKKLPLELLTVDASMPFKSERYSVN